MDFKNDVHLAKVKLENYLSLLPVKVQINFVKQAVRSSRVTKADIYHDSPFRPNVSTQTRAKSIFNFCTWQIITWELQVNQSISLILLFDFRF